MGQLWRLSECFAMDDNAKKPIKSLDLQKVGFSKPNRRTEYDII